MADLSSITLPDGNVYNFKDTVARESIPPDMVVLSYGTSTWDDFISAYNSNTIVYCRASSNSNPASGNQTRMAFMAYVNSTPPTEVQFQYYRSVSSHSATQQGDQVYIYKLNKTNGWSVTVREAMSKIAAGAGLSSSYSSGTITLSATNTPLEHIFDGSSSGSVRTSGSLVENSTYTMGDYAFAEGASTKASGTSSHAQGGLTIAQGNRSHAEGESTQALGNISHAEGYYTKASGVYSHAEGYYSETEGSYSHAEGYYTIAHGGSQHVEGRYNIKDISGEYIHIIGNGTSSSDRSNAYTLDWNGNGVFAGKVTAGSTVSGAMDLVPLSQIQSSFVSKSGDTITGNLIIEKNDISPPEFLIKNNSFDTRVDASVTPDELKALGSVFIYDSNDEPVFYSQTMYTPEQATYSSFITRKYSADGSSYTNHGFYQRINNDRTLEVSFPSNASRDAWVRGLFKSNNVTSNVAVSSNQWANAALIFTDSADTEIGRVGVYFNTSGHQYLTIRTLRNINGSNVMNQVGLMIKADGTKSVYVDDAEGWRNALGINNEVVVKTASSVSVATGTAWSEGTTITNSGSLAAGTYVIRGYVGFASNATGRRFTAIMTSNTGTSVYNNMVDSRNAINGAATHCNIFGVVTLTAATTLYLRVTQNSGSALTCAGRMEILKIH